MKNSGFIKVLIILLAIMVIAIGVFLILAINGRFKGMSFGKVSSNNEYEDINYEKTYDGLFEKINIDTDAVNLYIKESEDDKIKLVIYADEDKINVSEDENLDVEIKANKCVGFCFNRKMYKIELYLPEDYESNIRINSKYGNIDADKVYNIGIDSDYGNVNIGDVNILTVDSDYGNVSVDNIYDNFNMNLDYGNVDINNIDIKNNSSIDADLGNVKIGKTNEIYIDVEKELGDVDINNNYRDSEVTLKIKCDMGDIKIKN